MTSRSLAPVNLLVVLSLLVNLIPAPPAAPDAALRTKSVARATDVEAETVSRAVWLPLLAPQPDERVQTTATRSPQSAGRLRPVFDLSSPQTITLTVGASSDDAHYDELYGYQEANTRNVWGLALRRTFWYTPFSKPVGLTSYACPASHPPRQLCGAGG